MSTDPEFVDSSWLVVPAPSKPSSQSEPVSLGDRAKKLLRITQWSDLLAEGDEPYFGL